MISITIKELQRFFRRGLDWELEKWELIKIEKFMNDYFERRVMQFNEVDLVKTGKIKFRS